MLSDDRFCALRVEWLQTLERTDYFRHPDTDVPLIPRVEYNTIDMTVSRAIDLVAAALRTERNWLLGDYRVPELVRKRYIFYRVMRDKFPAMAKSMLAKKINRDPTTLEAGLRKFKRLLDDTDFRAEYDRVVREVG